MFRSICAWVAMTALVTSSFAQLTPQQAQRNAGIERRETMRNIELSKKGIDKAQAAGDQEAIAEYGFRMAYAYEQPNTFDHKPLDLTEARKWYAFAAAHGNSARARAAAYKLGLMWWDGRGGPEDKERAKYIWMWAAQNGDIESTLHLRQLNYDLQKERERALGKAQSAPDAATQQQKAEEGMAIVFGLLFSATLAKNYACQQEKQQQLMQGSAGSSDCR